MFIATLFIIVKTVKLPKCLSAVNGRKTVGNTLTMEYNSSVRKNKQLMHGATWMNLQGSTLSEEKANPRGYILYDSTFTTFLKRTDQYCQGLN